MVEEEAILRNTRDLCEQVITNILNHFKLQILAKFNHRHTLFDHSHQSQTPSLS